MSDVFLTGINRQLQGGDVVGETQTFQFVGPEPTTTLVRVAIPWCLTHDEKWLEDGPWCHVGWFEDSRERPFDCQISKGGVEHRWWKDTG